ncbi:MAG: Hsp70 family protein [Aeromicrobium sp.]
MTYGLGIDVGTTYTAAAVFRDGQMRAVTLGQNGDAMPTVVYLTEDGEFIVGDAARRRMMENPAGGAREFKRRLGDSTPLVLNGSPFSADRLMSVVIRHVVRAATQAEGKPPTHVVVTHPSNWQAFKIDLIRQAATAAVGPASVSLIEEPVAAAIYYAHAGRIDVGQLVGVYDLGGGTFDAAVLRRTADGFERLGEPAGIERLGGIDFDAALMTHVRGTLGDRFNALDASDRAVRVGMEELRVDCIEAKQALSSDTTATVNVALPGLHDAVRVTRGEFEKLIRPVLRETVESLRTALRLARATPDQLAAVLLIGGSSRIPLVADVIGSEIGRPVAVDAHPKLAVAMGAAIATEAALGAVPVVPPVAVPAPAEASATSPSGSAALPPQGPKRRESNALMPLALAVGAILVVAAGWFTARLLNSSDNAAPSKVAGAKKPFVEIEDVTLENGRYRVEYSVTGFTPHLGDKPGQRHIHFFLDTTKPENAGADGPAPGEWSMTDNLSSKLTDFSPANRGAANRMCAVVVDHNHAVVDPHSGNCAALPEDEPKRPTFVPRPRATATPTPTHTPTPTETPTATSTATATAAAASGAGS